MTWLCSGEIWCRSVHAPFKTPIPVLEHPLKHDEKSVVNHQLENVATANALQLEAARRRAVPIRFNFVARAMFEVTQPIRCRLRAFFLLIRYVTLIVGPETAKL